MPRSAPGEVDRLRREVERAMRENRSAEDILPILARLARAAAPESDVWIYAHRHLAELGVEHDPWRAALFARRVIARRPDDDGAWAVLGLAQSLLGNCRYAARAYEEALALAPDNPWYAHNLGHLYDIALNRAADALPLLARATEAQPDEADIAASYAHALARCGKVAMARRILKRATRRGGTADQMALARWLDGLDDTATQKRNAAAGDDRRSAPNYGRSGAQAPGRALEAYEADGDAPRKLGARSAARACAGSSRGACGEASPRAALVPEPPSAVRCDAEPAATRRPKRPRRRRTRERRSAAD